MADDFDINSTPTDEMTKNLSMLKEVSDLSQLTKDERQKAEKTVKDVLNSILSDKDMSPEKIRENTEILNELANKGLDVAKDAMEKIKENDKGSATTDTVNFSSVATQAYGHVVAQSHGHLKETLRSLAADGEGPKMQEEQNLQSQFPSRNANSDKQEDYPKIPKEKQMGDEMSDFMKNRYAQNSPERRKFEVLGPDEDRNENVRKLILAFYS